jgi:hypothetical protein
MLKDMLEQVSDFLGWPNDEAVRADHIRQINNAAREVYAVESSLFLREQTFKIPSDCSVFTLPWHVGQVRAIRRLGYSEAQQVQDLAPRYQNTDTSQWTEKWRQIGHKTLANPMRMSERLLFTLQNTEDKDVRIKVSGKTATSSEVTETVVLQTNRLQVVSSQIWDGTQDPEGIVKEVTKHNLKVYGETSGDLLLTIPNRLERVKHIAIEIHPAKTDGCIDVCYKPVFMRYVEDTDEFLDDSFEQVVVWKVRENFLSRSSEDTALGMTQYAESRGLKSFIEAQRQATIGKDMRFTSQDDLARSVRNFMR